MSQPCGRGFTSCSLPYCASVCIEKREIKRAFCVNLVQQLRAINRMIFRERRRATKGGFNEISRRWFSGVCVCWCRCPRALLCAPSVLAMAYGCPAFSCAPTALQSAKLSRLTRKPSAANARKLELFRARKLKARSSHAPKSDAAKQPPQANLAADATETNSARRCISSHVVTPTPLRLSSSPA